MKKQYIKPVNILLDMTTTTSILAASPQNVDPTGDGSQDPVKKDESGTGGWAASKGTSFNVWETDEDEE